MSIIRHLAVCRECGTNLVSVHLCADGFSKPVYYCPSETCGKYGDLTWGRKIITFAQNPTGAVGTLGSI